MRQIAFVVAALFFASPSLDAVAAEPESARRERPGFNFGGAPEWDRPPLAKNDAERPGFCSQAGARERGTNLEYRRRRTILRSW